MNFKAIAFCAALASIPGLASAQVLTSETVIQTASGAVMTLGEYCANPTNATSESCLILVGQAPMPVTNFVPIIGGVAAGLGAIALITGGGDTPSTTSN